MTTTLVVAFLLVHGLIHFAIWLPRLPTDPAKPVPFSPEHSAILTRTAVSPTTARKISRVLAAAAGVGFILAGLAVAIGTGWTVGIAVSASLLGWRSRGSSSTPG